MKKTIVLTFKGTTWDQPIVYKLSKDFNLIFNIVKAKISPREEGLLVLEITGTDEEYAKGIAYLKSFNIAIEPLEKDVRRIDEKCLHCGLCTSICPTKALYINRDTMEIVFDVNKCVGCESCVTICPPRAMVVNF